jgi:hypothetical protein
MFKISLLPKTIYRFNVLPNKTPMALFAGIKTILKFTWNHKRHWTGKNIEKEDGDITFYRFELYDEAVIIEMKV